MKKTVIGLATLALLTFSVPAFAQEINHTHVNTSETNILSTSEISVSNTTAYVNYTSLWVSYFNAPYSTTSFHVIVWNHTDNIEHHYAVLPSSSTQFYNGNLIRGKDYSVQVLAIGPNGNIIASGNTGVIRADTAQIHAFAYLN